jgi:hypothetical protein
MDTISHPHPYVSGGPWDMQQRKAAPGITNGIAKVVGSSNYSLFSSYPYHKPPRNNPPGIVGGKTLNDLLARSNPSRPVVSLPNFLFELRELPSLVKKAGSNLTKRGADYYLRYNYGIAPLVNDVIGMITFAESVDKRLGQLRRWQQRGGFKFTDQLGSASYDEIVFAGNSSMYAIYHRRTGFKRQWAQVSWVPSSTIPTTNYSQNRADAFKAVAGLTVDSYTVWEALPWSWLIDWFGDVGNFLLAHRNILGFRPGDCYVMTHSEASCVAEFRPRGNYSQRPTIGPSFERSIYKNRWKGSVMGPSASMPILSGWHFGILGALAIQRVKV